MGGGSKWIAACVAGEAIALSLSALLGAFISRLSDDGSGLVLVMPIVGAIEGALLGAFQAWALGRGRKWIGATSLALGAAWLVGALASMLEPAATSTLLILGVSLLFGLLVGALVGFTQSRVGEGSHRWWIANIAGWSTGMVASALLSEMVPWGPFTGYVFLIEALKGLAVGLCLGLVTSPYRSDVIRSHEAS